MKLTIHLHLVSRLKNERIYTSIIPPFYLHGVETDTFTFMPYLYLSRNQCSIIY